MASNKHPKRVSYKRNVPAGSAIYIGDTEPLDTRLKLAYVDSKGQYIQNDIEISHLNKELNKHDKQTVWLSICGLKDTDIIHQLGQLLDIHPLVIEDLLNTDHLSKVEFFPDYVFMIAKNPVNTHAEESLHIEQFSFILKENLLITFQESYEPLSSLQNKLKEFTVGELTYSLLDAIIDEHYFIVEQKADLLEQLEEKIIKNQQNINLGNLYSIKRDMLKLRKNTLVMQNIVNLLLHEKSRFMSGLNDIYLRDLQDHLLRIAESIDIHYELCTNILQIYLSSTSNKTNETMKVLTIFTAIFIPLSFIAGLFGMNFAYMPGIHWEWGYVAALGSMIFLASVLILLFRKRGWV